MRDRKLAIEPDGACLHVHLACSGRSLCLTGSHFMAMPPSSPEVYFFFMRERETPPSIGSVPRGLPPALTASQSHRQVHNHVPCVCRSTGSQTQVLTMAPSIPQHPPASRSTTAAQPESLYGRKRKIMFSQTTDSLTFKTQVLLIYSVGSGRH